MKMLERISSGIGQGVIRGIYEAGDGRHLCIRCNRMLKVGDEAVESWGPDTRYRRTNYRYCHAKCWEKGH